MITIQPEREEDYAAVHEINVLAFGRENEAKLVEILRKSSKFISNLSLVAVIENRVVGYILFTPIKIKSKEDYFPALALAPVAVHPEFQNKGIGSELLRQGLILCSKQKHEVVIVIGHPKYYPRFGFIKAKTKGIEAPFPLPDEAFMVFELLPNALNGITGIVIYPPEFLES